MDKIIVDMRYRKFLLDLSYTHSIQAYDEQGKVQNYLGSNINKTSEGVCFECENAWNQHQVIFIPNNKIISIMEVTT